MPTTHEVEYAIKGLSQRALAVVHDEKMTPAEKRETLDKIEADIKANTELHADLKHLDDARLKYAGAAQDREPEEKGAEPSGSWGQQFVDSPAFKQAMAGWTKGSRISTGNVGLKATMTGTASPVVQEDVRPGVLPILFQGLTVENLLASAQTNSSTVRYLRETTATNAAAAVAEEGLKPESTLILGEVDEPVRKIATTLKVTDEMLEDFAQVRGYIDGRLRLFIDQETEDQLLNGSGLAPNLTGLRNRTGMQADVALGVAPDTAVEAIYRQITAIRANSFLEPDGLVVHPNDWSQIRLSKDGNSNYYGGGPFGQQGPDVLWGLPVVITTAITEGTALVGAFRTAAQVFNRAGVVVEATNSNENDFLHNRVAIRAERRLALAVYRPGAFGEVTGI